MSGRPPEPTDPRPRPTAWVLRPAAPPPPRWREALAALARRARMPGKRTVLAGLFVAGAAASWGHRVAGVERGPVVVVAPAAPVLATPIPEARTLPGTRTLRVAGSSGVWEAPASAEPAPPRPAPLASGLPSPPAQPRTPADEVDRWVVRLARDQRADTRAALERMGMYEPLIRHALRERGLPADLLYLALIESHFLPSATSRAGAGGIWQFMPATARMHGLEVSEYVDERRDPIRSTQAAARHLAWLHRQFGSWHLALAAYNAGDGRVGSTLRAANGTWRGDDLLFWRVRGLLPGETRDYVPKMLAASRIARAPEAFGFTDLRPREPLRFREVSVPGGVSLAAVAAAVDADPEAIFLLNPHLVQRSTPPGRRWPVRIPAPAGDADGRLAAR